MPAPKPVPQVSRSDGIFRFRVPSVFGEAACAASCSMRAEAAGAGGEYREAEFDPSRKVRGERMIPRSASSGPPMLAPTATMFGYALINCAACCRDHRSSAQGRGWIARPLDSIDDLAVATATTAAHLVPPISSPRYNFHCKHA